MSLVKWIGAVKDVGTGISPAPTFLLSALNIALGFAFENYFGDGVLCCVRHGEVRAGCAGLVEEFTCEAVKINLRRAGRLRGDFDVLPTDAARPACFEGFERGFFGGKARGEVLRCNCAACFAVIALRLGENAFDKARRACDDFAHAAHFDDVYAG